MASLNKVLLIGNVGKDPEVRQSADGRKVVNITVATSETWKDKTTGEKKEATEWHRVVVFNQGLAGIVEQYVRKGSKLFLSGSLRTRKYTGQDGVERYTTEIVLGAYDGEIILLDSARKDGEKSPSGFTPSEYQMAKDGEIGLNDEIPF